MALAAAIVAYALLAVSIVQTCAHGATQYANAHRLSMRTLFDRRDAIQDLLTHDAPRIAAFSKQSGGGSAPENFNMTVASAAQMGTALYFVEMSVGTPPQKVILVPDTGSDLVWINCNPKAGSVFPAFAPAKSATASYVPCFSRDCAAVSPDLDCALRPRTRLACKYTYEYLNDAYVRGPYMRETVTLESVEMRNIFIGCGAQVSGMSVVSSSGVLGLGRGFNSFPTQTRHLFGGVFSYCLGHYLRPTTAKSSLVFGQQSDKNLSYTPILNSGDTSFYYIGIEGIKVAGKSVAVSLGKLRLDSDGKGGAIVDSGTSLTYWEEDSYRALMESLRNAISYPRATSNDPANFELCFKVSGFEDAPRMPEIEIVLSGGVTFVVPPENYVVRVEESVECVGFMSMAWPAPSIIGALLQQNYAVEYDLERSLFGFAHQRC